MAGCCFARLERATAASPERSSENLVPSQLVLPLPQHAALTRDDFVVAPSNAQASAFIDSWPRWEVPAVAIHGPSGAGKSHLVSIWKAASGADVISASSLAGEFAPLHAPGTPLAIEDVDATPASPERDRALFALLANAGAAILLTGREPPSAWPTTLPDLASRFSALLALPLWTPDDALLAAVARKLFADRQILVPDAVIARMLVSLERSPAAIRDFVDRADAMAMAEAKPINLALLRELLGEPS
jgi:chromosomal replication initiation ATPase DnaA